jgi:hypothetical protein
MEVPQINPRSFIFPLFRASNDGALRNFAGTCFLAHDQRTIVTALHNVAEREAPYLIVDQSVELERVPARVIHSISHADLAILQLDRSRPGTPRKMGSGSTLGLGTDVRTLEYSETRVVNGCPQFAPATRKGYPTRRIADPRGLYRGRLFELSFPALRGASGAPVINEWDEVVYAVIVANVAYHLLPAQIEEVLDERNEILESTQFLLPQGLAVPCDELIDFFSHADAPSA